MTKDLKCQAEESKVCCCVDVGTVIDNTDCTVEFTQLYTDETQAKEALDYLTQKAHKAESEPCHIQSNLVTEAQGVRLNASFKFCCQAESMIFQLSTR